MKSYNQPQQILLNVSEIGPWSETGYQIYSNWDSHFLLLGG